MVNRNLIRELDLGDELEQEIINQEYYVNKDVFNNMVPIRDFHNYIKTKLISYI